MYNDASIKEEVRKHYAGIAGRANESAESCCGSKPSQSCGCGPTAQSGDYTAADLQTIPAGADLGLGCGHPVSFAGIREGDVVLDLGSGAGIDVFLAARQAGPSGKAIGVDMTEAMIAKARNNAEKIGAANVDFRLGEIEALPVESNSVDMVISNCVINLVPSKEQAFAEIFRVLKPGGKFTVSDIVLEGTLSEAARRSASLWAGCVSGAVERNTYLGIISQAGFNDIGVLAERKADDALESAKFFSITVSGTKP